MRIIDIFSPLGGVGKTTLAVNLAASLAELGKRVLLVDLDAQSCATTALGLATEPGGSLYSALVDGTSARDVVRSTRLPNLFVIRSHYELASVDVCLVRRGQHLTRLREVMAELHALPDFDYIFLDCSPSMGVMTNAAMAVADELIVPLQPGFMMLPAVSCLLGQIQQVIESGVNPGLHVGGFVINRFNGDAAELDKLAHELHAPSAPKGSCNVAYPTAIPESTALAEAPSYGQTIVEYDPKGRGTEAYRALAKKFIDRQRSTRIICNHIGKSNPQTATRPNDTIMSETLLSVQILNLVLQQPGITDGEITSAVGKGVRHQQINQVCHKLKNRGKLTRSKRPDDGHIGNYPNDLHLSETQPAKVEEHRHKPWSNAVQEGIPKKIKKSQSKVPTEVNLRARFNEAIIRSLDLPPIDYSSRLDFARLLIMKSGLSRLNDIITIKLTAALAARIATRLKLTDLQRKAIEDKISRTNPNESGFDLDCGDPNFIGEVKSNIPINESDKFGSAQFDNLTNDVLQMCGHPPIGMKLEELSKKSKVNRLSRDKALKFIGLYNSDAIKTAVVRWLDKLDRDTKLQKHPQMRIQEVPEEGGLSADVVYLVYLNPE